MAIPTFVAAGTEAPSAGNATPGLPAGWAADDIHLLVCETVSGEPVTAPTGFTAVADSPQIMAGSTRLSVFWRRAVLGDTDPTISDPGNHIQSQIFGFRGCITTGNPWDVTSGGTDAVGDTALVVPGDTTTVADCLVVICASIGADSNIDQFSLWANADLANVTERGDAFTNLGGGGGFGVATGEKAAAGAYGNTTATMATAEAKAFITIALKAPGGGNLTGTLFTNAPVFNTGLISHLGNLLGVLFTKAPTFHVGVVTQEQVSLTAFPIRQQISHLVTPGTSISGVLRAAPIEDNMVFALVSAETTLVNLTGPSGYTKAAEEEGDAVSIQLWYKRAGAAESATVTVTSSVSVALKIHVFESPAGMFIVDDPLDVVDTNDSGLSSVTTLSAGTTATVSQTNTFAIAAVIARSANLDFGLVNWSDGFTALSDYETLGLMTAYKVMTAAEAATTTATWSQLVASHRAAGLVATFAMTVTLTPPAPAPRRVSFGSRRDELNTTGTVDTVATFPMVADHLYLAFVVSSKQLINDGDSVIENSHGGQPWTLEQSHSIGAARRVHVFRSVSATDLAAASISITTPEADIAVLWTVLDVTGFDPSGVNGAGAIRQVAAGDENSGDVFVEVSFVSAPLATSGVVGLCLHGASERQLVDVSPLHLLFSESKVSDSSEQVTVDWYHGSDDTFRWDWATSIHAIAIIAEIAVPLIGVSQTPNATTSNVGWDTAPSAGQSIHTYIATDDTDYITVTVP